MSPETENVGWLELLDVLDVEKFESVARSVFWGIFLLVGLLTSASAPGSWSHSSWLLAIASVGVILGAVSQNLLEKWSSTARMAVVFMGFDTLLLVTWSGVCLSTGDLRFASLAVMPLVGGAIMVALSIARWNVGYTIATASIVTGMYGISGAFYLATHTQTAGQHFYLSSLTLTGVLMLTVLGGVITALLVRQGRAPKKQLEKVARLQRRMLNQVSDAVFICTADGRILDGNSAAEELVHMSRKAFLKKKLIAVLPGAIASFIEDSWSTVHADGFVVSEDVRQSDDSGTNNYYNVQVFRHRLGEQDLMQVVVHDASSEHSLDEQQAHLAGLKSLRKLSRGIAHDFNNMFATIQASSFLLEELTGDHPGALVEVRAIREATNRAVQLVNQILDLTDMRTPVFRSVDVRSLVDKVLESYHLDESGNIETRINIPDDLLPVLGDSEQVARALHNIVGSSIAAMLDGGQLTISAEVITLKRSRGNLSPGSYVKMRIQDTGIGIPSDMVERVFDPFFSDDGGRWIGFALANARAVIARHGGRVTLRSDLGRGSVYTVLLPASHDVPGGPPSGRELRDRDVQHGNVLVVDDDPVSLKSMVRLLRSRGYQVQSAAGGREAIDMCERQDGKFDVMVLDMLMPGISGKNVLETMHARYPDIRVLIVTGYAAKDLLEQLKEQGAAACLRKPFDVKEMLDTVRRLVREE